MTKELEELKRLAYENACCRCQYYIDNKCINKGECVWLNIETALKENEELKMELVEWKAKFSNDYIGKMVEARVGVEYKKLKALEIIKKKKVAVPMFIYNQQIYGKFFTCDVYNSRKDNWLPSLTQEEFVLLKEVLL